MAAEIKPFGSSTDAPARGWVLFDGSCGFCSWWIPFLTPLLRSRGYSTEKLQAEWVTARLGLKTDELLSDIRLLRPDGVQIVGANVYRDVIKRFWWLAPIYLFSEMPLGKQVFDWSYKLLNKNRYRISRSCRLS